MGSELKNMEIDDLENILHEISRGNTRDMSTFRDVLLDWYGGVDIRQYQRLESYIRNEMGLGSDAELWNMSQEQKLKVIEYFH